MPRKRKGTPTEIRDEIQRRIRAANGHDGRCVAANAPWPVALKAPDATGCNWRASVDPFMTPECIALVEDITRQVMAEFDLIDV